MFSQPATHSRSRWTWSLLISFALHCLGLTLFLLVRQHPTFVKPSSILAGKGGSSTAVVYLARNGVEATRVPRKHAAKKLPSPPIFVRNQEQLKTEVLTPESNSEQSSDTKGQAARAGSQFGSLLTGPVAGHEVRPALPVVFPDPVVHRSELPSGVQGDVVVEVTIDTRADQSAANFGLWHRGESSRRVRKLAVQAGYAGWGCDSIAAGRLLSLPQLGNSLGTVGKKLLCAGVFKRSAVREAGLLQRTNRRAADAVIS